MRQQMSKFFIKVNSKEYICYKDQQNKSGWDLTSNKLEARIFLKHEAEEITGNSFPGYRMVMEMVFVD